MWYCGRRVAVTEIGIEFGPTSVAGSHVYTAIHGQPCVAVGNAVYHDVNTNGVFDAGDSGIDGVTMELLRPGIGPDGIPGKRR